MPRNPGGSLGAIIVEPERPILTKHLGTNPAVILVSREDVLDGEPGATGVDPVERNLTTAAK
jgi:hypothetical protein